MQSKFNFIPEAQLTTHCNNTCFSLTVTKGGILYFSHEIMSIYDIDKSLLKLFVDVQNKLIGFKIISKSSLEDIKGTRKIHVNPKTKAGLCHISKILQQLGFKNSSTTKKSPYVFNDMGRKYKMHKYDSSYLSDTVYYIDLNEKRK